MKRSKKLQLKEARRYEAYQRLVDEKDPQYLIGLHCPKPPRQLKNCGKKRNYNEQKVLKFLTKEKRCTIKGHTISIWEAKNLGNKSLGKLDFLQNYCGWFIVTHKI